MMEKKIQDIVFPTDGKTEGQYKLYYRNYKPVLDYDAQKLTMMDNSVLDFATYLNGCTISKWKKYTSAKTVKLELDIVGKFAITLTCYSIEGGILADSQLGRTEYDMPERDKITIEFPECKDTTVGFEITSYCGTTIYGGCYYGVYADDKQVNEVDLSLATTTCRKEEFILGNLNLIEKAIYESDDDMKNHFYVHVIDNGRTLDAEAVSRGKITVHPNKNTGGSGGFARGMIESLHQEPAVSHVLLMDDDVLILPESLRRTYRLLTLLDEEYKTATISGAMLRYELMFAQHEDIGTIRSDCRCEPLKRPFNHNFVWDNVMNEMEEMTRPYMYGAWWYCCMPITTIKENGLPLPVFIRCDDSEYGLRAKKQLITMNGICIWHMGFLNKYNFAMDGYQMTRNFLISRAVGSMGDDVDAFGHACEEVEHNLARFNYNAARVAMRAVKDYLDGPEFLEIEQGEKIMKENVAMNEKFKPFKEYEGINWRPNTVMETPVQGTLDRLWFKITFNGQRLWPEKWLRQEPEQVAFNDHWQPQKNQRRKYLIPVNPDLYVAAYREMDKKQFKELHREWKQLKKKLYASDAEMKQRYQAAMPYLTSEEFWRKYLEI